MKNFFTVFLITLFTIINFTACNNKNEPEPPQQLTNEQHLTNNKWKLNAVETSPAIEGVDPMDFLDDCYIDNIYSFLPGGILSVDEGNSKCHESDPQVVNGTWKLTQDQQQLELKYAEFDQNFTILDISEEQMKVQTTIDYQGFSILSKLTFLSE